MKQIPDLTPVSKEERKELLQRTMETLDKIKSNTLSNYVDFFAHNGIEINFQDQTRRGIAKKYAVIWMCYRDELSTDEIAEQAGIGKTTVLESIRKVNQNEELYQLTKHLWNNLSKGIWKAEKSTTFTKYFEPNY